MNHAYRKEHDMFPIFVPILTFFLSFMTHSTCRHMCIIYAWCEYYRTYTSQAQMIVLVNKEQGCKLIFFEEDITVILK